MFRITIKNMLRDKKVTISLIVGFLLSIAIVSSIPIYTRGILNKVLHQTFINYQPDDSDTLGNSEKVSDTSTSTTEDQKKDASKTKDKTNKNSDGQTTPAVKTNELYKNPNLNYSEDRKSENGDENKPYPAMLSTYNALKLNTDYNNLKTNYDKWKQNFDDAISVIKAPIAANKTIVTLQGINFNYKTKSNSDEQAQCEIEGISDINKHVKLIKGEKPKEAVYEENNMKIADIMVDKNTYDNLNLEVGKTYEIVSFGNANPVKFKVSAVFEKNNDKFWLAKDNQNFYGKLIMSDKEAFSLLQKDEFYLKLLKDINFRVDYDYNLMESSQASSDYKALSDVLNKLSLNSNTYQVTCSLNNCLKNYIKNASLYETLIWIFNIPIIAIILFYVYVISGFVVEQDKDQIAIFKSRGISLFEILRIYFYEGLMLCGLGIILGPILGYFICKFMSYVTGFLQLSSEADKVDFFISVNSYLYAVLAAVLMLITLLISAYFASKKSIVEVKRNKNKYLKSILSHKNLDFLLLAISIYGYYVYSKGNTNNMFSNNGDIPVDPLLYMLSTVFIVGVGMFLLRLYRYIVKLVHIVCRRGNSTAFYLSTINVLRYHLSKNIILIFVIMTIGIGIFDMKIAKNVNLSNENTVKYSVGADMTLQQYWDSKSDVSFATGNAEEDNGNMYVYSEPSQAGLKNVKGIESYTKVLNVKNQAEIKSVDGVTSKTSLQGIKPYEFGKVAWFDSNLLNFNWYYYLNAMTKNKNYILISSGLSKLSGLKKGDSVSYRIENGLYVTGTIMDVVSYWPGYENLDKENLIVGNFDYIFSKLSIYPYEVWLKKDGKASNKEIYDSMLKQNLNIIGYKDTSIELNEAKENEFFKATNAILSLGIIAVTIVTIIAYMLYWTNSLKNRKLSFGVYRSLGVNSKKVTLILVIEQIFTLGASVCLGIISGNAACNLFLPIITGMWKSGSFSLPVNYIDYTKDYLSFGTILLIIFIASLLMLLRYITKLKINEAIKLGED